MEKKVAIGFFLLFMVMFSTIIVATPPAGNYTVGTSWCENSATNGPQMYTYEGGGVWAGPYACPGGCSSLGTGGHCAAPSGGEACAPEGSTEGNKFKLASVYGDSKYICI